MISHDKFCFYKFCFLFCVFANRDDVIEESASKADDKVEEEKEAVAGPITVFFGSQTGIKKLFFFLTCFEMFMDFYISTGTAEGFSEQLKQEGDKHGFNVTVADLEDFDADEFNESLRVVIMVMATYGEGEPTDNASTFIKWAKVQLYTYVMFSFFPNISCLNRKLISRNNL